MLNSETWAGKRKKKKKCVCQCVCVCVRERERRGRGEGWGSGRWGWGVCSGGVGRYGTCRYTDSPLLGNDGHGPMNWLTLTVYKRLLIAFTPSLPCLSLWVGLRVNMNGGSFTCNFCLDEPLPEGADTLCICAQEVIILEVYYLRLCTWGWVVIWS
jgi:hypothetical protein